MAHLLLYKESSIQLVEFKLLIVCTKMLWNFEEPKDLRSFSKSYIMSSKHWTWMVQFCSTYFFPTCTLFVPNLVAIPIK